MLTQFTRRSKAVVLTALAAIMLLVLSACGAEVDTNLTLSKDGKGTRTISAKLSTENLSESVTGGLKAITASLEKHTPENLSFKGMKENKADNEATATFELAFDSLTDYETKINELLLASDSDLAAEINTVIENNDFVSGFATEENFTSTDLLGWALDGLVEDGVINESDSGSVFTDGTTKVKYEDKSYESDYSRVFVNQVKDNGFDLIKVNTVMNEDSTFNQEIVYQIGNEKVAKLGAKLTDFLKSATVEGELEDYYGEGSMTGWSQSFTATDTADLATKTNTALGSKKVKYDVEFKSNPEQPTHVISSMKAAVDCDSICSPDGQRVQTSIAYPATYTYVDGTSAGTDYDESNNTIITPQTANFTVNMDKSIPLESINVVTDVAFNRSIQQTYNFLVAGDNAALAGDGFKTLLAPEESIGTFEAQEIEGGVNYVVKISADSAEELNTALENYRAAAFVELLYPEGFNFWPDYGVAFSMSPQSGMGDVAITNGITAAIHLPFAHKFDSAYASEEGWDIKGGDLSVSSEDSIYVQLPASGPSVGTFVIIGIIVLVVLIAALLALIFRKRIRSASKKAWERREEAVAAGKKVASGVAAASVAAAAGVSAAGAAATATVSAAGAAVNAASDQALFEAGQGAPASAEFTEADIL